MLAGRFSRNFRKILKNSRGATAVEYGLVVALVCIAALTGMGTLGGKVKDMYDNIQNKYSAAVG
jgi:pilus assembly protein Flp/PilA